MNELHENKQNIMQDNETQQKVTRVRKVLGEEISQEEIQAGELDQLELLQEVYKGATTGMQSIEVIRPMAKDKAFKNMLFRQYNEYKSLSKEIELQAANQGYDLRPSNIINKAMMYGTVLFNTMNDRTNSKLSEIMIQGINMGIISLVRVTNSLDADLQIDQTLSNKLMQMYQNNLEAFKAYL